MPLYDYKCQACGHSFEQFQKVDDRNKPTACECSECGKNEVQLMIGIPAVGDAVHHGGSKLPKDYRDRLDKIQSQHPRGNIKRTYG